MKHCCVIGFPLINTLSPAIHQFLYKIFGLQDIFYNKNPILDSDFSTFATNIKNYHAISITVPYKEKFFAAKITINSEDVNKIEALNTIVQQNGSFFGYNTDWIGFEMALKLFKFPFQSAIVVGTGGVSRAVIYALNRQNIDIHLLGRDDVKLHLLRERFNIKSTNNVANIEKTLPLSNLIINCTNANILDVLNIGIQLFKDKYFFDTMYENSKNFQDKFDTICSNSIRLINSNQALNGIDMLIFQAIEQFKLYSKINNINELELYRQIKNMLYYEEN